MAVRGHIPLDMYPSLDRGTGHINSTALVASVLNMQNKIATLEDSLLAAGIADGGDSQSFIGHRLALVEQEVSELHEVETNVLLPMDAAWVISCATLVFLMQLGFAQLEAGMCRPKNVIATYLKNIADFVLGSMCTLFVGFAIAYDQVPLFDKIDAWQVHMHTHTRTCTRTRTHSRRLPHVPATSGSSSSTLSFKRLPRRSSPEQWLSASTSRATVYSPHYSRALYMLSRSNGRGVAAF